MSDEKDISDDVLLFNMACNKGKLALAKKLVETKKVDPKTECCYPALHLACISGHAEIVKWLVTECKMDPNTPDDDGLTSLHWACACGQLDIVKWLVTEAKVDLYSKDKNERTPIEVATYADVMEWLAPRMNKVD